MFSTPLENLTEFVKTRPPLILFLVCLIAVTITTFSFAFYFEHNAKITNSDVMHDWMQMIKHFNELDYCIGSDKATNSINESSKDNSDEIGVQINITIENMKGLKENSLIKGLLSLEGWQSVCPKENYKPDFLRLELYIPNVQINATKMNACGTVFGPKEYLPSLVKPVCEPNSHEVKKVENIILLSKLHKNKVPFCETGFKPNMQYSKEKFELSDFLTQDDRQIIFIHLMWTSYVLVFIILGIILYGVFHKDKREFLLDDSYIR